ncbi:MAG: hypothetical protein IJM04_14300 [Prevotella sp.]|nr:hypothetical protein [Prevotella sp.]
MKKIAIAIMLFMLVMPMKAQDKHLQQLVSMVTSLRRPSESQQRAAYNELKIKLAADKEWTPMDELVDEGNGECRPTKKMNWFRLNTLLMQAPGQSGNLSMVTKGDFLNGEDPRFNYSLIEKGIRQGATVRYTMKGREGAQTFVIVPYDAKAASKIKATITKDGDVIHGKVENGNIVLKVDRKYNLKSKDRITLEIKNDSGKDMAVVILNHNTRK